MGERLMCEGEAVPLTEQQAAFVLSRIMTNYGRALVVAKWEGVTPLEIKGEVARQLAGLRWDSIVRGLDHVPSRFPEYPPHIGQIAELCKSFEPTPTFKALPAPDIHPNVIAARKAEAEKIASAVAGPRIENMVWAERHRAAWLAGANLQLIQITMSSGALREVWKEVEGVRRCLPKYAEVVG